MKEFSSSAFEIFHVYNRIAYYFLISPYKIIVKDGSISFKSSIYRKVCCQMYHLLALVVAIVGVKNVLQGAKIKDDPKKLFRIWAEVSTAVMTFAYSRLCLQEKGFQEFIVFLYEGQLKMKSDKKPVFSQVKIVSFALFGSLIAAGFVIPLFAEMITFAYAASFEDYVDTIILKLNESIRTNLKTFAGSTLFDKCISAIVYKILFHIHELLVHFQDMPFICASLSIYFFGKDFWKFIKSQDQDQPNLSQILEYHRNLKTLCRHMNSLLGLIITLYLIIAIPIAALQYIDIFDADDWYVQVTVAYYLAMYIGSLALAAEGHRNIKKFDDYIATNFQNGLLSINSTLFGNPYNLIVQSPQIGLGGGETFIISYSFLGNILGILMTYIIITLQFEQNH